MDALPSNPTKVPSIPVWWVPALLGYAAFLLLPQVLNDGDTYTHLATGAWIIRHGAIPRVDPFSYTVAGKSWVPHEWLSELIMWLAFRYGGWVGLLAVFGAASALAFGLLAKHLASWFKPLALGIALLLAASCVSPSLLVRPHILVLPILEMWSVGLIRASESQRIPWFILPLMPLWANMHGSFPLGIGLIGPFALESLLSAGNAWRPLAAKWLAFGTLAISSALVTPFGWQGFLLPIRLLTMKSLGGIQEWQQPDFQHLPPIEIALAAALYVCLSRGIKIPTIRLWTLMGLLHLALSHSRHQLLAGVVGTPVIAGPLGRGLGHIATNSHPSGAPKGWSMALLVSAGAALIGLRLAWFPVSDPSNALAVALNATPSSQSAEPVLNDYGFGGYLIFRNIRPFIDSRAELYGDEFLTQYAELMRPDDKLLSEIVGRYHIKWMILRSGSPISSRLASMPAWQREYADGLVTVYVLKAGADAAF